MPNDVDQEAVEVRIDGTFDVPAAQRVVRLMERAPREARVLIDLTRVREFHDFAIAVLAQSLTGRTDRVTITGLGSHQLRTLSYLGLGGLSALGDSSGVTAP